MIRLAFLLFLLPVMSLAQDLPALFDVTGVAKDDVLNVRAAPSGNAPIVGSLNPGATSIEVTETNDSGTWGRLNVGETSGWASLRYLERQPGDPDYALARSLRCFGTEPFWSLSLTQGQEAVFSTPDSQAVFPGAGLLTASRNTPGHFAVGFDDSTAIIRRATCSDGMSDQNFGLTIDLLLSHGGDTALYSGCCRIDPR